jgi:hypothetical protein
MIITKLIFLTDKTKHELIFFFLNFSWIVYKLTNMLCVVGDFKLPFSSFGFPLYKQLKEYDCFEYHTNDSIFGLYCG